MDGVVPSWRNCCWLACSVFRSKAESGLYTVQLARGADRKWDLALEKSDVDAQSRKNTNGDHGEVDCAVCNRVTVDCSWQMS